MDNGSMAEEEGLSGAKRAAGDPEALQLPPPKKFLSGNQNDFTAMELDSMEMLCQIIQVNFLAGGVSGILEENLDENRDGMNHQLLSIGEVGKHIDVKHDDDILKQLFVDFVKGLMDNSKASMDDYEGRIDKIWKKQCPLAMDALPVSQRLAASAVHQFKIRLLKALLCEGRIFIPSNPIHKSDLRHRGPNLLPYLSQDGEQLVSPTDPNLCDVVLGGDEVDVDTKGHLLQYKIDCRLSHKLRMSSEYPVPTLDKLRAYFGIPAVEVFYIKLINMTNSDLQVFGKIAYGSNQSILIYDRPKSEPDNVKPYGSAYLSLTSPDNLCSSVKFTICACLCDWRSKTILNTGWYSYDDWLRHRSRKPQYLHLSCDYWKAGGNDGDSMTELVSHLVIYDNAIGVKVRVELSSGPAEVYGTITAASSMYPRCESILFLKRKDDKRNMACGDIPLLKSVVAIPLTERIIIRVHLPGIARGMVSFSSPKEGSTSAAYDLQGISVSVTWGL